MTYLKASKAPIRMLAAAPCNAGQLVVAQEISRLPSKPKILVAAQDKALLSSLVFALEQEGYETRSFGDLSLMLSETAETLAASDCIVIDQDLVDAHHRDLVLPACIDETRTRVILLTAHPTLVRLNRSLGTVAVRLVEKPLLGSALADTIRSALGSRDRQQDGQTATGRANRST